MMMTMLPIPKMETQFGKLYEADCMSILPRVSANTVDLVFADPPFNLGKEYMIDQYEDDIEEEITMEDTSTNTQPVNRFIEESSNIFDKN